MDQHLAHRWNIADRNWPGRHLRGTVHTQAVRNLYYCNRQDGSWLGKYVDKSASETMLDD